MSDVVFPDCRPLPPEWEDALKVEFRDAANGNGTSGATTTPGALMFLLENYPLHGDSALEGLFMYGALNWNYMSARQRNNVGVYYESKFDGSVQKQQRLDISWENVNSKFALFLLSLVFLLPAAR